MPISLHCLIELGNTGKDMIFSFLGKDMIFSFLPELKNFRTVFHLLQGD